jgi:Tfp pilus assembly protein PilO
MARLNQKQTLLVISGATVLLCGGAGGGVHWAEGLIEEEKSQISTKEREIESGRKKIEKIPDVEKKVIILRENVKEYVKILPKSAELSSFTRKVQEFAIKSGISIDRFVPVRGAAKSGAFEKMSYQYYFRATLWQYMKFMNFFENYARFVSIRDFTLSKGSAGKEGEDAFHSMRMTVETYVYNPKSGGKRTKIVNYDVKVKRLRPFIQAAGNIDVDPYTYSGREGRRDIFVDPRISADENAEGIVATMAQQRRLIEDMGGKISVLKQKWQRSTSGEITMFEKIELLREVDIGLKEMATKITDVAEKKLIKNPALSSRWYKEVQLPYKDLAGKLATGDPNASKFLGKADFDRLINSLKEDLGAGELDAAISKYNSLQPRIEVAKLDPRYALRVKVESLIIQAKIAKEFSAISLKISGVVVNEVGKSGVILNGEVFEEGEYIDSTLFVKAVRQEEIEFVYKGFTLLKTL